MPTAEQLTSLYKNLEGKGTLPLEPNDPYYVERFSGEANRDPIQRLQLEIQWAASESVHLLTGFRGNGKSTELRRLKRLLEDEGHVVFLVNMLDYLIITKPLELSDFILSLMVALSEEAGKKEGLGLQPLATSYWERLGNFLQSKIQLESLTLKSGPVGLGAKLKNEPDFKTRVQEKLRGHLDHLVRDAQEFVDGLVRQIRTQKGGPEVKVVLLVDSVEQIRGQGTDAQKVHNSVVELFSGQAYNLAFPKLHVLYTVPPYLPALSKNLGRLLGGRTITQWPNIHVRHKDGAQDGQGLALMQEIIAKRCSDWPHIFAPEELARLAYVSGGDLRDFFRLIKDCLVSFMLPGDQERKGILERAMQAVRNEMLPLADEDARRLAMMHTSKREELPSIDDLSTLARFLDSNIIMNYQNGEPWYDIHPLLLHELYGRGFLDKVEA
jgi:energy-coupling factor transporter ATP-binding protein EcfA2